ncbi:TetR/AcrR family transcriptional regulator [Phyllobacterium sp. 628]|uniref:TetR/AcrR family transcriptional regulator n=1 Tax=Phyllobacterium sp. 628 TaxID=2718938 RepID=UPI00166251A1|nr:TetR/AcrR family transcriptional regulator [Phyllobacterium sp. 628]QND53720.1 TetR/AcrR family transcriptional regulator [Phyllobacterium sp. 628]
MPRPSDAKTRFIDTAVILFQAHGYHGVGLTEIIAQAKAPKGSFYFHFPGGKEELAEHAVRSAGSYINHILNKSFMDAPTFRAGAEIMIARLSQAFEASGWTLGCPITSVLLDTTPKSERLSVAIQEVMETWIGCLSDQIVRFHPEQNGRSLAMKILVSLEGAWILARMLRSREPFEQVMTVIAENADRIDQPK